MPTIMTNLNVRIEKKIKLDSEVIFNKLGLNMTTAINLFLRQTIRNKGIPFELKIDEPNMVTTAAIEEGRLIARDETIKSYNNMKDLRRALEE